MTVAQQSFTTGLAVLPDVGKASYNGVVFSSLFNSNVSWGPVPDNSGRCAKWIEVTLELNGPVTLPLPPAAGGGIGLAAGLFQTTDTTMALIRQKLSQYGGALYYQGKGYGPLVVNAAGGGGKLGANALNGQAAADVNYGPKTELIDFKPLGGSKAALVTVRITTYISEYAFRVFTLSAGLGGAPGGRDPVVQFNEETSLTYDEDCYAQFSVRGTLEVPLTRSSVNDLIPPYTVDTYRKRYLDFTTSFGVDLTRFKVSGRGFQISRDKRTCEWDYRLEEQPFMGNPPGCPTARGTFTFSDAPIKRNKFGTHGFVTWSCSLNCTYTVAKGLPRRIAQAAFLSLLQWRMTWGAFGQLPSLGNAFNIFKAPPPGPLPDDLKKEIAQANRQEQALKVYGKVLTKQQQVAGAINKKNRPPVLLYHFSATEGLYQESRTTQFEASWKLLCGLPHVLIASGMWRWPGGTVGGDLWAQSVRDISGYKGNVECLLDPDQCAIVDLGG